VALKNIWRWPDGPRTRFEAARWPLAFGGGPLQSTSAKYSDGALNGGSANWRTT